MTMVGQNVTLSFLAKYLSARLHRMVIDRTDLAGRFDFIVELPLDQDDVKDLSLAETDVMAHVFTDLVVNGIKNAAAEIKSSGLYRGARRIPSSQLNGPVIILTVIWLGSKRGDLSDWLTQLWVRTTGRKIRLSDNKWLDGPVGNTALIGKEFFFEYAKQQGLKVACESDRRD